MAITRRNGGMSGKVCVVCQEWKILGEFPDEDKRGKGRRFQSALCSKCAALEKFKEKKKSNEAKKRKVI